jgi:formylmethanofuran dehydrogenase subunit E
VTLFKAGIGAVRVATKPECLDRLAQFEFSQYREAGKASVDIPVAVTAEVVEWLFAQPDEALFAAEKRPHFQFRPMRGSLDRAQCVKCNEYVFERYVREKDGKPHCIPCAGYAG